MILTLTRYLISDDSVAGQLFVDGQFACYTLEDAIRETKVKEKTCIPAGVYSIELRTSPKFSPVYKHDLLWLKDVPNFEYILIHRGNTVRDTAGCILVGRHLRDESHLTESALAYNELYGRVAGAAKAKDLKISIVTLK